MVKSVTHRPLRLSSEKDPVCSVCKEGLASDSSLLLFSRCRRESPGSRSSFDENLIACPTPSFPCCDILMQDQNARVCRALPSKAYLVGRSAHLSAFSEFWLRVPFLLFFRIGQGPPPFISDYRCPPFPLSSSFSPNPFFPSLRRRAFPLATPELNQLYEIFFFPKTGPL